jgi:hypothetical protein
MSRLPTSTLAALALSAVIGLASGSALAGHGGGHGGGGHGGAVVAVLISLISAATWVVSPIAVVTWVISHIWVISATPVVSLTWVVSVTFALPVIGRIAIGRGAIPGTVTSGPLVVGITERVGSIDLGDG